MLTTALVLGVGALGAYLAFASVQTLILANASLLVTLICPVSMLVMMWGMRGGGSNAGNSCHSAQAPRELPAPEAARQNN